MRKYVVRGKTSEGRAWWSGMGWTHDWTRVVRLTETEAEDVLALQVEKNKGNPDPWIWGCEIVEVGK